MSTAGLVAVLCVAPIFYAHRESPRTLVSAHGLLHVAIAQRFASTPLSGVPPENPFFAGVPVPYYWFFHYCGARLGQLLGMHPLYIFEWMILAAVCIVWLTAASLGHRLYGGVIPGLALGLLAFGGTNPFGVAILLGKIGVRGLAPLRDDPSHLWGIAHPILSVARLNDPFDLYGPVINFFFNISSRPIGLAFVLVIALCMLTWLQRGSVASWVLLVLSTALCTAFSLPVGAPGALALGAGLVLAGWLPLDDHDGMAATPARLWRRRTLSGGAGLVLGVVLAAPTYYHLLLGEAERAMHVDLSLSTMVRLGASAGLILGMAAVGTIRGRGDTRRFLLGLLAAGAVLVGAGTFIELPAQNDCNLFQAGALLLALPAVASVVPSPEWSGTRARLTWLGVVIVFLPTMLLVMFAYLHRPPIALAFTHEHLERVPADSPLARLYAWVRRHTAADAVFILDPEPPFAAAVGNMPEFPALTERVMFTSYAYSYMVAPHHDAALRHEIAKRLLAGEALDARQAEYLVALRRPLYLVVQSPDASEAQSSLRQRFGEPVFRDRDAAVFAVDAARTGLELPAAAASAQLPLSTSLASSVEAASAKLHR
jgi:hypothetical protein